MKIIISILISIIVIGGYVVYNQVTKQSEPPLSKSSEIKTVSNLLRKSEDPLPLEKKELEAYKIVRQEGDYVFLSSIYKGRLPEEVFIVGDSHVVKAKFTEEAYEEVEECNETSGRNLAKYELEQDFRMKNYFAIPGKVVTVEPLELEFKNEPFPLELADWVKDEMSRNPNLEGNEAAGDIDSCTYYTNGNYELINCRLISIFLENKQKIAEWYSDTGVPGLTLIKLMNVDGEKYYIFEVSSTGIDVGLFSIDGKKKIPLKYTEVSTICD